MADDNKPTRVQGSRPDRVRLVVLVYKKHGMSIEDFQTAWYVLYYKSIAITALSTAKSS